MGNLLSHDKFKPDNILYINQTPYLATKTGAIEIGSKNEQVNFAAEVGTYIYKLVKGSLYRKDKHNPKAKEVREYSGLAGVVITQPHNNKLALFGKGNTILYPRGSKYETMKIEGIREIENIYVPSAKAGYCILQDSSGTIFTWTKHNPEKLGIMIPGKEIKTITYHSNFQKQRADNIGIVTDEGLFLITHKDSPHNLSNFLPDDYLMPSKTYRFQGYKIPLPNNMNVDDIQDIRVVYNSNIFLLDNNGKVYARGKNGYNQRGTTKKLKIDEWNEIKYPEKIKQIETLNVPGILALSENGNLYYHGYNEGGYYPITGKKSNISKPLKIAENVHSLWVHNEVGETGRGPQKPATILYSDKEGNIYNILTQQQMTSIGTQSRGIIIPEQFCYDTRHSLNLTKAMIKTIINHTCM